MRGDGVFGRSDEADDEQAEGKESQDGNGDQVGAAKRADALGLRR